MDYAKTRENLLRAIRGKRSQLQVSRRLGFKFNKFYRWEKGLSKISWKDFQLLCKTYSVSLPELLKIKNFNELLETIYKTQSPTILSERTGISKHIIKTWLSSRTSPSLEVVLQILERDTRVYQELVESFLNDEEQNRT